jgi:phosphatidylserine/phosphatidylglycerophosphate/cardiolipin synthase-like enzyme
MARTFSILSSHLSRFIGTAFINADRIVVVSPWVSDVTITFPETEGHLDREMSFSDAVREFDVEVTVIVDPEQRQHNQIRGRALLPKIEELVTIKNVDDLHAKAIITNTVLYLGSANMTYSGLNVNIELCEIRENKHRDIDKFLADRLAI